MYAASEIAMFVTTQSNRKISMFVTAQSNRKISAGNIIVWVK